MDSNPPDTLAMDREHAPGPKTRLAITTGGLGLLILLAVIIRTTSGN